MSTTPPRLLWATANLCTHSPGDLPPESMKHGGPGLFSTGKQAVQEYACRKAILDMIYGQEERMLGASQKDGRRYTIFSSGAEENGTLGTALWFHHRRRWGTLPAILCSSRIIWRPVVFGDILVAAVSAHVPTDHAPPGAKDKFWCEMEVIVVTGLTRKLSLR